MKPEAGTISPGSTNKTTNDQAPPLSSDQLVADERLGLYIALFIVGTIGNTALITVVMRRKTQKSVYEMFVLNLGVSDLLLLLLHIVPNVHVMVTDFEASSLYCNFIWPMNTVVFLLEIFTVTSMALHRYWLIVHPYTPKPTRRATGMWIAGVWVCAVTITLPLMIITRVVSGRGCVEDWPTDGHRRAYTVALMLLEYVLPLVVIATAYVRIAAVLIRSRVPCGSLDRTLRAKKRAQKTRKENLQVVKTLATIVFVFSIGMLPIQVAWMIKDFGPTTARNSPALETLFIVGDLALCFHASLDPLIYGVFARQYRREYVHCACKMLGCCACAKIKLPAYPESSATPTPLDELRSTNRVSSIRATGESTQILKEQTPEGTPRMKIFNQI